MGSDLFDVRVTGRSDTRVSLAIRVVHPDAMYLTDDLSFALMVLREGAEDTDPLGREVSYEDAMDGGWLRRWARGFVRSATLRDLENELPEGAERDHEHPYWDDPGGWLRGTLDVEVTHPSWVSHLKKGAEFPSRAFESASEYDACEPIAPRVGAPRLLAEGDAFLPLPRELLIRYDAAKGAPRVLRSTRYSESAYRPLEQQPPAKGFDHARRAWIGQPVIYETRHDSIQHAVLLGLDDWMRFAYFAHGSTGYGSTRRSDIRWIGRAGFVEGARTGEPLTLAELARNNPPCVLVGRRRDDTLELAIRVYSERYLPRIEHAGHALGVLGAPFERPAGEIATTAPLGEVLARELKAGGRPFVSEVYSRIAHGYVAELELRAPKDPVFPDLGAMDAREAAERFDSLPWPEWELTVRVTDPAWIEHFPAAPYSLPGGHVAEPAPWSGAPARWRG